MGSSARTRPVSNRGCAKNFAGRPATSRRDPHAGVRTFGQPASTMAGPMAATVRPGKIRRAPTEAAMVKVAGPRDRHPSYVSGIRMLHTYSTHQIDLGLFVHLSSAADRGCHHGAPARGGLPSKCTYMDSFLSWRVWQDAPWLVPAQPPYRNLRNPLRRLAQGQRTARGFCPR